MKLLITTDIEKKSRIVWGVASLTISLSLLVPNGYSIGATLILLLSFFVPFIKLKWKLENTDLIFISSLLLYSFGMFLLVYNHEASIRGFDKPSRFFIAIFPLLLLLKIKDQSQILITSCLLGSVGAFLIALYDRCYLGLDRAGGDHNPIMFGGIAMMLSSFCLNFALYFYSRGEKKLFYFASSAFFAGLFASFLSGSKGSWVVLPLVIPFLLWNYRTFLGKIFYLKSVIVLAVVMALFFNIPSNGVSGRVGTLVSDIELLRNGSDLETSASHRTELWKASFYMFEESPFVGLGKTDQEPFKIGLVEQGISHKSILKFTHAHNEYLNELSLRGVFGLLLLLNVFLVPLLLFLIKVKGNSNSLNVKAFALAGALIPMSYMVFGLTQSMFTHNVGVIMYAFPIVFFWAATRWAEREERELGNIA